MTAVVPYSPALAAELRRLPETVKRGLKLRRHDVRGLCVLYSRTWGADEALARLVERFGEARWVAGRWQMTRPQLALPGLG